LNELEILGSTLRKDLSQNFWRPANTRDGNIFLVGATLLLRTPEPEQMVFIREGK
jgi:hypothetical protein